MTEERRLKGGPQDGEKIHDLVEVVAEENRDAVPVRGRTGLPDERVINEIREVAERIAKAVIPGIVERVVREEIEKLKKMNS